MTALVYKKTLGLYEVLNIKSGTVVSPIKDILLHTQIYLEKCRAQCYDGGSNMQGKKSHLASKILDIQPKTYVTHCHCHSLSLALKNNKRFETSLRYNVYNDRNRNSC